MAADANGKSQTRRERLEQREQAIISVAHVAFVRHGFDGTKMAEIARLAGVAEGTIYLYFKNKSALLLAVVGKFYAALTKGAAIGIEEIDDCYKRLEFIARHHVESCIANWPILEHMSAQYRHIADYESGAPYEFNKTYVAVFDGVIREAVSGGLIRKDVPLWIIRDLFFGSLEYSIRTHLLRGGNANDIDVIVDKVIEVLRRGIGFDNEQADRPSKLELVVTRLETVASRLEQ